MDSSVARAITPLIAHAIIPKSHENIHVITN